MTKDLHWKRTWRRWRTRRSSVAGRILGCISVGPCTLTRYRLEGGDELTPALPSTRRWTWLYIACCCSFVKACLGGMNLRSKFGSSNINIWFWLFVERRWLGARHGHSKTSSEVDSSNLLATFACILERNFYIDKNAIEKPIASNTAKCPFDIGQRAKSPARQVRQARVPQICT